MEHVPNSGAGHDPLPVEHESLPPIPRLPRVSPEAQAPVERKPLPPTPRFPPVPQEAKAPIEGESLPPIPRLPRVSQEAQAPVERRSALPMNGPTAEELEERVRRNSIDKARHLRRKGNSPEKIKAAMVAERWPTFGIEAAMAALAAEKRGGRPRNSVNEHKRHHRRRDPLEQARRDDYCRALRAVYLALECEQDIGLFGPRPADGRDTKPVILAKRILHYATKAKSMAFGAAFCALPTLGRESGFGKRMTTYHAKTLFAASLCFVKRHRKNTSSLIYPALNGVPVHPSAPGYDREKVRAACAVWGVSLEDDDQSRRRK